MRERVTDFITKLQETIVTKLEPYGSGQNKFRREPWVREEGGGGLSCTFPPLDASPTDSKHLPSLHMPTSHAPSGQITPSKKPVSTSQR